MKHSKKKKKHKLEDLRMKHFILQKKTLKNLK